jgi:hypothetical protein
MDIQAKEMSQSLITFLPYEGALHVKNKTDSGEDKKYFLLALMVDPYHIVISQSHSIQTHMKDTDNEIVLCFFS